jgi:hypothetical protein
MIKCHKENHQEFSIFDMNGKLLTGTFTNYHLT